MDKKPNLVLGAIRGYKFEQIRPFVVSLKRTTFNGDLVLLWNNLSPDTLEALQSHGVKLVHFSYRGSGALNSWSRFWPVISKIVRPINGSGLARRILKAILPLQTSRFFHYRDYLAAHRADYGNVLITDVRDVVFQADPFVNCNDDLLVFEEGDNALLADEKMFNAKWVEQLFGKDILERIGRYPILCSGTVMGGMDAMINYLVKFETLLSQAREVGMGGADQGVHNYLCRDFYTTKIQVVRNGAGAVLTMVPWLAEGADFKVSNSGEILGLNGQPVPVLHQYDRHPALASKLVGQLVPGASPQF
jgi:hypothetical protein